jgi:hypothetical protein
MDCNQDLFPGPQQYPLQSKDSSKSDFKRFKYLGCQQTLPYDSIPQKQHVQQTAFVMYQEMDAWQDSVTSSDLGRYKQDLKQCAMIRASQTA